jgi:hypothetical protein
MSVERALRAIVGAFVLATASLAIIHSLYWLLFTAFFGTNLFQSGFTKWCPMVWILEKGGTQTRGRVERRANRVNCTIGPPSPTPG